MYKPVACLRLSLSANGSQPVTGDWNDDGRTFGAVYSGGTRFLDNNGNAVWDGVPTDRVVSFGLAGELQIPGRW